MKAEGPVQIRSLREAVVNALVHADSPQLDRLAGLSAAARGLLPLVEPARKNRKLPVDQLKGVTQQLCQSRWLSASELAALVDRDAEKLQSRFFDRHGAGGHFGAALSRCSESAGSGVSDGCQSTLKYVATDQQYLGGLFHR